MAYVPQDNFLFSDTIEHNIAFGLEDYDLEEVKRFAELSDVHGNISEFAEGYSTILGERGVTVSGGQKQRISIARALMKGASILILDDSASALDYATDAALRHAIKEKTNDMTVFIVSQRASSIMHADKILVLDDGECVASGTHEELLSSSSLYREIYETQFSGEGDSNE
jgi:ATP-binding cassette subfamily B protein